MRSLSAVALTMAARGVRARFETQLRHPARVQERVRQRIVRAMARTAYGRRNGIAPTMTYRDFADRIPIVTYEMLESWIDWQMASRARIVAPDPVLLFEETSGSSGARKRIPYTGPLLRAFHRAFLVWAADLILDGPPFRTGRMFFAISPAGRVPGVTRAGVSIGLADDTQYVPPVLRRAICRRLVVPPAQSLRLGIDDYRLVLACRLLAEADLEIISVWSPTYLTSLMRFAEAHRDAIASALTRGRLAVPGYVFPMPVRPSIRDLLREPEIPWARVWPALALLSCWTDGPSEGFAEEIARRLPVPMLQGKGLLATEAAITVPLRAAPAPVPLVGDLFLEFGRDDGTVARLEDVEPGEEVEVIVTQRGGLVRYRMGDRVRVAGRQAETPCLRFLGRDRAVSDLVGEKLHDGFVRGVQEDVLGRDAPAVLVPTRRGGMPCYVCLVERPPADIGATAHRLDEALGRGFQYRQARFLGQLRPVEVVPVPDLSRRVEDLWLARGIKWGDIKPAALLTGVTERELARLLGPRAEAPALRAVS